MLFSKKLVNLMALVAVALILIGSCLHPQTGAEAKKHKSDILFLKGKFILKDKKGAVVIADDHHHKKPCHCGHSYFYK